MKFVLLISIFLIIFTASSTAQLDKGNWLLGGNISYSRNKSSGSDAVNNVSRIMDLRPNAGYFFAAKFVGGLALDYENSVQKYKQSDGSNTFSRNNNLAFGPFFRYYILPSTNQINIFPEISGSYAFSKASRTGSTSSKYNEIRYGAGLGAAFFLNTSVAIEVLGSYNRRNTKNLDSKLNSIQFHIGLNYYLEREKP